MPDPMSYNLHGIHFPKALSRTSDVREPTKLFQESRIFYSADRAILDSRGSRTNISFEITRSVAMEASMELRDYRCYYGGHDMNFAIFSDDLCRARYLESIVLSLGQARVDVYEFEPGRKRVPSRVTDAKTASPSGAG